jgi:hypothetical protein
MTVSSALPPLADGVTLCELGVDNLRGLRMGRPVELRRLTLLAGRNGIGKSTFARVFPLLRQSAGRRKREPILWWERGEVDFGAFDVAVRRGSEEITFTFSFADPDGTRWTATSVLVRDNGWSRVRRVAVEQGDRSLSYCFGKDGQLQTVEGRASGDAFTANHKESIDWLVPDLEAVPGWLFGIPDPEEIGSPLHRILHTVYPDHTETQRLSISMASSGTLDRLFPWTDGDELLGKTTTNSGATLKKFLANPEASQRLRRANFCYWGLQRLSQAGGLTLEVGNRTAYLGPFRADPERAYAPQGLAVDRLDPRGSNLAMFLASLSPDEREDLNAELSDKLGFTVSIETAGGFYSLHVELNDGRYNLVDVGYGYSQVLPVAVQLWASRRTLSTRRDPAPDAVVVIEQPEIHLHPHQQVLLGRALAAFAADDHGPMHIIETHSEHLIGEVGRMIARGQLAPERVGVLCFEPHDEGGTKVFQATFNEHGVLHDWPVGFLSP